MYTHTHNIPTWLVSNSSTCFHIESKPNRNIQSYTRKHIFKFIFFGHLNQTPADSCSRQQKLENQDYRVRQSLWCWNSGATRVRTQSVFPVAWTGRTRTCGFPLMASDFRNKQSLGLIIVCLQNSSTIKSIILEDQILAKEKPYTPSMPTGFLRYFLTLILRLLQSKVP